MNSVISLKAIKELSHKHQRKNIFLWFRCFDWGLLLRSFNFNYLTVKRHYEDPKDLKFYETILSNLTFICYPSF
jgi:hypothetical protein